MASTKRISSKQLAANRANAQKSTGPSATNRLITRFNAVKSGVTGQILIIAPEERPIYDAFSQRLHASLNPWGEQEVQIATRIIRDTWRLNRAAANEENIYALGLADHHVEGTNAVISAEADENGNAAADPLLPIAISHAITFAKHARDFNLYSLYEQRTSRRLHKDYALFRQLQKDRNRPATDSVPWSGRYQPNPPAPIAPEPGSEPETPALSPLLRMPEPLIYRALPKGYNPNGFVFSNGERDEFGHPRELQKGPIVVNADNPYVPPYKDYVYKTAREVDCDW